MSITRSSFKVGHVLAWLVAAVMGLGVNACGGGSGAVAPLTTPIAPTTPPTAPPDAVMPSVTTLNSSLSNPWGMAVLPSGELLVTQRGGSLLRLSANGASSSPISGVLPVNDSGQGGLLGLALDPEFATSPWVYWAYSESGSGTEAGLTVTYYIGSGLFDLSINVIGIDKTTLTNSHIHLGAPGVNGGIIFDLGMGTSPNWTNTATGMSLSLTGQTFPAANVADMFAFNTYLNLHTAAFPGGEIRGQIGGAAPVPLPAAAWLLGSGLIGLVAASRKKAARS